MINLKNIATVFIVGFILSFIAGLIGGVNFGVILLRALFSGLVFSVLAVGAGFIYNKFLTTSVAVEQAPASSNAEPIQGKTVDIVVDDDLPDSTAAPSFNVGAFGNENRVTETQSVTNSVENVSDLASIDDVTPDGTGFQSASLDGVAASVIPTVSTETSMEGSESERFSDSVGAPVGNSDVQMETVAAEEDNSNSELDVLPDIDNFVVDEEGMPSSEDDVIQDSVFAQTGQVRPSEPTAVSEMGDAKEIAAAIRTALVKDM